MGGASVPYVLKMCFFGRRSKAGPSSSILASVKSAGRLCGGPAAPSVGLVFRANNERLFACCASLLSYNFCMRAQRCPFVIAAPGLLQFRGTPPRLGGWAPPGAPKKKKKKKKKK